MKKIIISSALVLMAISASAQTVYDAYTFSKNDYIGTARSLALGNAMTALGGDLGSFTINPAGSAVNSYSQLTFTPGYALASTNASFDAGKGATSKENSASDWNMPNIGLNMVFDAYSGSRLKTWSFGLVSNATAIHLDNILTGGRNSETSFMGAMAQGASQYSPSQLAIGGYYGSSVPWNYLVGYDGFLISDFGGEQNKAPYRYAGATEATVQNPDGSYIRYLAGDIDQTYKKQTSGIKKDLVMNFGANFDDTFYVGLNIGMPHMSYSYDEYMGETAVNPNDFTYDLNGKPVSFQSGTYQYSYAASISGIYAKLGFIWRPTTSVRIGGAIQTPTTYEVTERWAISGGTCYTDKSFDAHATSPTDEFSYMLSSPYRANVGAAIILGSLGLVSVDYEMCDYSSMRFSSYDDTYVDFTATNKANSLFMGRSNMLRAGAEFHLGPKYSLRAGYTFTTCPEYTYIDNENYFVDAAEYLAYYDDFAKGRYTLVSKNRVNNDSSSFSIGVGYSSDGSFFCDAAVRVLSREHQSIKMYDDYVQDVKSPVIDAKGTLTTALVTFGWRF